MFELFDRATYIGVNVNGTPVSKAIQFPSPTIHCHLKHFVISLKQSERSRQLF